MVDHSHSEHERRGTGCGSTKLSALATNAVIMLSEGYMYVVI